MFGWMFELAKYAVVMTVHGFALVLGGTLALLGIGAAAGMVWVGAGLALGRSIERGYAGPDRRDGDGPTAH